jgi:hypothetical protein
MPAPDGADARAASDEDDRKLRIGRQRWMRGDACSASGGEQLRR